MRFLFVFLTPCRQATVGITRQNRARPSHLTHLKLNIHNRNQICIVSTLLSLVRVAFGYWVILDAGGNLSVLLNSLCNYLYILSSSRLWRRVVLRWDTTVSANLPASIFRVTWRWRQDGSPKRWYPTAALEAVTTQKTWTCIFTAVKTLTLHVCTGILGIAHRYACRASVI
jgi:hypothetical protein